MKFRIAALCLAFVMLGAARLPGKLVQPGQTIQWSMGDGLKVYRLNGLYATFDRVQCAPLGPDCEPEDLEPKLTIRTPDGKSLMLDASPMSNQLMLGRIAKEGPTVAFVQSYTGGMHCCREMRVIVPGASGPKVVELGGYDGAEIDWPKDIDGDGNLDFVVSDDRFLYAFESYAGSVAPPQVLNVIDGRKVDVSADPRFRKVFEKASITYRKACIAEAFPNGACAAYAATAARSGQLDAAWAVIVKAYQKLNPVWPNGCKVARDREENCPDGQAIEYPDYPTALRAYLVELGYTPPA